MSHTCMSHVTHMNESCRTQLDDYVFWQDEQQSAGMPTVVRGYKTARAVARESGAPLDTIVVTVTPHGNDTSGLGHSDAVATIERVLAVSEGEGACQQIVPKTSASGLVLLNSQFADTASPLGQILKVMLRLDNLSHLLVWGTPSASDAAPKMKRIELPRLGLSFLVETADASADAAGSISGVVLRSQEHDGLIVSNCRTAEIEKLLHGMPHALVLQDDSGDLYLLASAAACPSRPNGPDDFVGSNGELFSCAVLLDRGDSEWLANVGQVRHYLYPVHISKRFLVLPSLAASLSLLVFKVLHRCYEDAVRLAGSCISDTPLSVEEAQIWRVLEDIGSDTHPDAVGCRLHISRATSGSTMRVPWCVGTQLATYCQLLHKISSCCRLSVDEEMVLLDEHGQATRQLRNRASMLSTLSAAKPGHALQLKVEQAPRKRKEAEFDEIEDKSCLEDRMEGLKALFNGVSLAPYHSPEQGYGSKTVVLLNGLVDSLTLSGQSPSKTGKEFAVAAMGMGKATPGFILCLELLSSNLDLRVLESDSPRILGMLLLRLLPAKKGLMMSILRVVSANPSLSATLPSFWKRYCNSKDQAAASAKKGGILGRITGLISDGFDATKFNSEFLKAVCAALQKEKGKLHWPPRHPAFRSAIYIYIYVQNICVYVCI